MIYALHNPPRWTVPIKVGLVAAAFFILLPQLAMAQSGLHTEALRAWPAAEGTSAFTSVVDNSVPGTIVFAANRGVNPEAFDARCVITVVDDDRATVYTYRHRFQMSVCVDATAHPEGGFFVRGAVVEDFEDEGEGFTAYIDAEGDLVWVVEDQMLRDAEAHPEGTGEFSGSYVGPHGGLAYDEATDRLMALTMAEQVLPAQEIELQQAHIVTGDEGRLVASGRRFGPRLDDPIVDHLSRDGEFLVHTVHEDDDSYFYSYDGRRQVSRIDPGDEPWGIRQVVGSIQFWEHRGTVILWTDRIGQATTGITRIEGLDDLVWTEEFESVVDVGGVPVDIGEPERLWVGNDWIAVRTRTEENDRFLRLFDAESGEPLAAMNWYDLVDIDPIELVRNASGNLELLAVDRNFNDVWLFELGIGEGDDEDGDRDGEAREDEGGGCSATGGAPPSMVFLVGLAMIAVVRSRRPQVLVKRMDS